MCNSTNHLRLVLVAALIAANGAGAQIPGAPVLQNAFANQGLAFAANFGSGGDQSLFAVAAGWGLGSGRILVSGAAGAQRINETTRGAYGARASATVWTSGGGSLGVGAFAGIGGAPRTRAEGVTTNAALMTIPAGVTAAWRRPMGTSRGFSAYVSPLYRWSRVTTDDAGSASEGNVRFAGGVDFSFNPSLGVTLGGELGSGDTGATLLGLAISWVPGGAR